MPNHPYFPYSLLANAPQRHEYYTTGYEGGKKPPTTLQLLPWISSEAAYRAKSADFVSFQGNGRNRRVMIYTNLSTN